MNTDQIKLILGMISKSLAEMSKDEVEAIAALMGKQPVNEKRFNVLLRGLQHGVSKVNGIKYLREYSGYNLPVAEAIIRKVLEGNSLFVKYNVTESEFRNTNLGDIGRYLMLEIEEAI